MDEISNKQTYIFSELWKLQIGFDITILCEIQCEGSNIQSPIHASEELFTYPQLLTVADMETQNT